MENLRRFDQLQKIRNSQDQKNINSSFDLCSHGIFLTAKIPCKDCILLTSVKGIKNEFWNGNNNNNCDWMFRFYWVGFES